MEVKHNITITAEPALMDALRSLSVLLGKTIKEAPVDPLQINVNFTDERIDALPLSTKAFDALNTLGVMYVSDLVFLNEASIKGLPKVGRKTAEEIIVAAAARGITLGSRALTQDYKDLDYWQSFFKRKGRK